jgi:hypothetical protein
MGVQVNQSGKDREAGPIDAFGAFWCWATGGDGRNLVICDADALTHEDVTSLNVNEAASL